VQAAAWYRRAAEQGDFGAQFALGSLYYNGKGLAQDYAEAYVWLDLATAAEPPKLKPDYPAQMRDEAASHLTPTDLSRVHERSRKWFEGHAAKPQ
jgi:uncharacterized protein